MFRFCLLIVSVATLRAASPPASTPDQARVDATKQLQRENRRADIADSISEALTHDPAETPAKSLERATEGALDAAGLNSAKRVQREAEQRADERRLNEIMVANYVKAAIAARGTWERQGRTLRDLLQRLADVTKQAQRIQHEIDDVRAERRKNEREKEIALEDLRRGEFCSGCGQTRTQIESAGQRFPHQGQARRPARPEDFQKLEAQYASIFATLKSRGDRLEDERKRKANDARDLHFQFMTQLPPYHRGIADEEEQRQRAWNTEKDFLEKQLDGIRARLTKVRAPAATTAEVRALERDLADNTSRAQSHFSRAEQEAIGYVQAAKRDVQATHDVAQPVIAIEGVPTGWFLGQQVLSTPTAIACRIYAVRSAGDPVPSARSLLEPAATKAAATNAVPAPKGARDALEGR